MTYSKWKSGLHDSIELHPIELAGRGKRLKEPFYEDFETLLEDVYQSIQSILNEMPYMIFGHSLGCLIAYELYAKIISHSQQTPKHLFFSGRNAPHIITDPIKYHTLLDEELQNELIKFGGTPKEFFEDMKLSSMFMQIIRADFRVVESYHPRRVKLDCPITVLGGKDDVSTSSSGLLAWKSYTNRGCRVYKVQGGHFFINENPSRVLDIINETFD